jgi:hypothetical protein
MEEVIQRIRTTDEPVSPLDSPDEVCSCCPKLQEDHRCEHEDRTSAKDAMLLELLGLVDERTYSREELKREVLAHMTGETFERSCGKCSWREQGLCSYELWRTNFVTCF